MKARRAIGVSAFFFALLHENLAFFGQLGGFSGLSFLSSKYLLAISFSSIALVILFLMAATSFDFVIVKLTFRKWKLLHRFVYLAGFFIMIHALMLGTHFSDLSGLIPEIFFVALVFLLFLETLRIDAFLANRFVNMPRFGLACIVFTVLATMAFFYVLAPSGRLVSLGIHAQHIFLAKQAQQQLSTTSNIPGLSGDRTKRFSVSFYHDDKIQTNQDTVLRFQIFDASSGNPVVWYKQVYEKTMHLIVVDSLLSYFNHIHPTQKDSSFLITTSFPKEGKYHLYINFQPLDAIEQQFAFVLDVGENPTGAEANFPVDTKLTKVFDQYEVTLKLSETLKASELSIGNQKMTFMIKDAKTKQPVTKLKPYLAAFGHLVMINEKTYDYLHVHPTNLVAPSPSANGGPDVTFLPLGLYGPIKPGIYRVFAQFNPNANLMIADYTIRVE